MIEQLKEQIKIVAEVRQRSQRVIDYKRASLTDWETLNRGLLEEIASNAQELTQVETTLRELTLQAYAETGNKAPAPGVGVREVIKLDYDGKVAFDWAVEHRMALKLDTLAFEKIAKVSPPDFVRVFSEPQATIATQLEV